jgi:hypothetical protein
MEDKDKMRNVGIIGAPNSGASEVFQALVLFGYVPPKRNPYIVMDNVDLGEYGDSEKPPYNAKDRKRLFGED